MPTKKIKPKIASVVVEVIDTASNRPRSSMDVFRLSKICVFSFQCHLLIDTGFGRLIEMIPEFLREEKCDLDTIRAIDGILSYSAKKQSLH